MQKDQEHTWDPKIAVENADETIEKDVLAR
jgi:hypothetical protein